MEGAMRGGGEVNGVEVMITIDIKWIFDSSGILAANCGIAKDDGMRRSDDTVLSAFGPGLESAAEGLVGSHQLFNLGGGGGFAEEEALHFVAADGEEEFAL